MTNDNTEYVYEPTLSFILGMYKTCIERPAGTPDDDTEYVRTELVNITDTETCVLLTVS